MMQAGRLTWPALPPDAGIRATALGLSEYSVQLSGNTIYVPDPQAVLPRRNLRVMQPRYDFPEVIAIFDFGTVRVPSNTVPITIKSLLFLKDPRMEHTHAH